MEGSIASSVFLLTDLTESHSLDYLTCQFLSFFVIIFLFEKYPISACSSAVFHITSFQFFFFFFFLHLSAYLQENNLQAAVLMSCSSVTKWKIYLIFPIIGTHCVILYRIHPLKKISDCEENTDVLSSFFNSLRRFKDKETENLGADRMGVMVKSCMLTGSENVAMMSAEL